MFISEFRLYLGFKTQSISCNEIPFFFLSEAQMRKSFI